MSNKTASEYVLTYCSGAVFKPSPCIGVNKIATTPIVTTYVGTVRHLGRMRPTNYVASQIPIFNAKLRG